MMPNSLARWLANIGSTAPYVCVAGAALAFLCSLVLVSREQLEIQGNALRRSPKRTYQRIIWPARMANALFSRLYGSAGDSVRELINIRSVLVTFFVSVVLNGLCISVIVHLSPFDSFLASPRLTHFFLANYLVFIASNFLGDLVSVTATRWLLQKIISGKCNFFSYAIKDFLFVVTGYFVSVSPAIFALFCDITALADITTIAPYGLLGPFLIPMFLFFIATTSATFPFIALSLCSVLSIWIPTLLYLGTLAFNYLLYSVYLEKRATGSNYLVSFLRMLTRVLERFFSPITSMETQTAAALDTLLSIGYIVGASISGVSAIMSALAVIVKDI